MRRMGKFVLILIRVGLALLIGGDHVAAGGKTLTFSSTLEYAIGKKLMD